MLSDLYLEKDKITDLASRIVDYHITLAKTLAKNYSGRIDAYYMTDDWGTQETTLISVPMWREHFKPLYKKLFDAIHEAGMHAYLHSCGKINDLFPEFIEIGKVCGKNLLHRFTRLSENVTHQRLVCDQR